MRISVSAVAMRNSSAGEKAGIPRYEYALVDQFVRNAKDHEFVVFHGSWFKPPAEWVSASHVQFVPISGLFRNYKTLWDTFASGQAIRRHGTDVHLSCAHALPALYQGKQVLVIHDLFPFTHPELYSRTARLVLGHSMRRSIRRADRLLAISHFTKSEIVRLFGLTPERIAVTHLGPGNQIRRLNANEVSDHEIKRLGIPFNRFLFTLSTLEPRKNLRRLLEALSLVRNDLAYSDLGLVVAGAKGWMVTDLPSFTERLGLGDAVSFVGYVDDIELPKIFARCEAYVSVSLVEGFGITVLEAMLAGAPVVCSSGGSLPEVGGDAAIYVDATSPKDIARGIKLCLSDPVCRTSQSAVGSIRAARFDWAETAKKTLDALEDAAT